MAALVEADLKALGAATMTSTIGVVKSLRQRLIDVTIPHIDKATAEAVVDAVLNELRLDIIKDRALSERGQAASVIQVPQWEKDHAAATDMYAFAEYVLAALERRHEFWIDGSLLYPADGCPNCQTPIEFGDGGRPLPCAQCNLRSAADE